MNLIKILRRLNMLINSLEYSADPEPIKQVKLPEFYTQNLS